MMSLSDEDCPFSEEERRAKASFIDVLSSNLSQFQFPGPLYCLRNVVVEA